MSYIAKMPGRNSTGQGQRVDTHRANPYMEQREADAISEWEDIASEYSVRALLAMLSLILVAVCAAVVEICGGAS